MIVPLERVLFVAAILFAVGLTGLLVRRNVILMLLSVALMLNGSGVAFVAAGAHWKNAAGQVFFLFMLAAAAAEVAVGLALVLLVHRRSHALDAADLTRMRG